MCGAKEPSQIAVSGRADEQQEIIVFRELCHYTANNAALGVELDTKVLTSAV